ncbi:hypothetical protein LAZ67_2003766 [Cordylochernes scorpioides]|uniref:DDE-1 domain-containing protein n=1 Tax=Cordylochernes scorpioides TaxID=51811 RepID=A0ABY6K6M0_9ARAC|nr:hypothetical protein LAZ67_2003766 [Cordylochernes scorpioides]
MSMVKRLHGEAGSVDANSVATWKGEIIPSLLAKYSPQDIFIADETGLFYKLLPNQTMTIRGEKCEGGKKSKERITVLVCCNMDGSEKLPLLYIGKYRRPRCFHGMNIPSNYHFNKKASMTGAIFTDWLKKLDQIFKRRERKILLILDNCPAHQIPEGLQNIEIRFLPALTTSALQPCDMAIIKALKDQFRKRIITYLLTCMEEKKNAQVHLLFAISWLEAAWVGVSSSTIKNCFSHSGFVMDEAMEEVVEEEMNRCFEAIKKHQAIDVNYINFLEVDKDVQVAGEQSIEEIVKEVMGKEEDEETSCSTTPVLDPPNKECRKNSFLDCSYSISIAVLCKIYDLWDPVSIIARAVFSILFPLRVILKVGNKTSGEVDKLARVSSCTVGDLEDPPRFKIRFVHMTSRWEDMLQIEQRTTFLQNLLK